MEVVLNQIITLILKIANIQGKKMMMDELKLRREHLQKMEEEFKTYKNFFFLFKNKRKTFSIFHLIQKLDLYTLLIKILIFN